MSNPIAWSDVVVLPSQSVQLGSKELIEDDDRHHETDAHDPRETKAVGFAWIPEKGVPAVLGGIQRQE